MTFVDLRAVSLTYRLGKQSTLALADATAIMFLALLFHALSIESAAGAAVFASAAIGCRRT